MKVDILAIGVHPDDVELSCVGTLLKHLDAGKTVGLLDLTEGELGTRGSVKLRYEEAEASRKLMGAAFRKNLQMPDGFFRNTPENIRKIIEVVRWCRPEIALLNAPSDRHPDHGRAAKLCSDALYYAGLKMIETEHEGQTQTKWRPKSVYHYIQDYNLEPDFVLDITGYLEKKFDCIACFKSQFHTDSEEALKGDQTPISGPDFMDYLRSRARIYGRPAGFEYAEGFIKSRTVGVRSLFDLS